MSNLLVCRGLIKSGERQDEESVGGRNRTEALRQLCQMNPSQALNIRAMVVRIHSYAKRSLRLGLPLNQALQPQLHN